MSNEDIKTQVEEYQVIYADPPWQQTKGGLRLARPNQGKKLDYTTLTFPEIEEHIRAVGTTDNSTLFVWTIDKYLLQTHQLASDLGYRLHARIIWDKTNGVAPAFTVRFAHEYLLWFYRGKFQPIAKEQRGKWTTVLREKATKHSKKPTVAYEFIESIYPDANKIELYARIRRAGWDAWGNELPDKPALIQESILL